MISKEQKIEGTEKCMLHKILSLGKFSIVYRPIQHFTVRILQFLILPYSAYQF